MSYLILIRHSTTRQQPEISSHLWTLTPEGIERCQLIVDSLQAYNIGKIFTSPENKALLTAKYISEGLSLNEPEILDDVRETTRHTVKYHPTLEEFQEHIHRAMQQPDEVIFGEESFSDALSRFTGAVNSVIEQYPYETVAIVSHGTVMSLYIASITGIDVFEYWKSLEMPDYSIFQLPEKTPVQLKMSSDGN